MVAGAAIAARQPEITTARTIRLQARADNFKNHDTGRERASIGDQSFISGALFGASGRTREGHFDVSCSITDTKAQVNNCQATFSLEGGEIVTGGVSIATGAADVDAVFGGTGV